MGTYSSPCKCAATIIHQIQDHPGRFISKEKPRLEKHNSSIMVKIQNKGRCCRLRNIQKRFRASSVQFMYIILETTTN